MLKERRCINRYVISTIVSTHVQERIVANSTEIYKEYENSEWILKIYINLSIYHAFKMF